MRIRNTIVAALLVCAFSTSSVAEVRLPSIIGSHMVLQRDMKVPIWGWAAPGEKVTVAIDGQSVSTTAGEDGKWQVKVGPLALGKPREMTVSGKNEIQLTDILIGEVWLAGGQSNMATALRGYASKQEIAAINFPTIRLFKVEIHSTDEPQKDCKGKWTLCDPANASEFGANAYYFGKYLHEQLKMPVGMIHDCVSGTPGESWASPETIKDPAYQGMVESFKKNHPLWLEAEKNKRRDRAERRKADLKKKEAEKDTSKPGQIDVGKDAPKEKSRETKKRSNKRSGRRPNAGHPRGRPAGLYNGMIVPVAPFAIKGVIWWQGEGNQGRAGQYTKLLTSIIQDWRKLWGQGDFVFISGQLQNVVKRKHTQPIGGGGMPAMREAFLNVWKTVPNTGMAVACDIGDTGTHFKNKKESGRRLALAALGIAYGKDIVYSGPIYDSMKVEGAAISLQFKHVGGGLTLDQRGEFSGFGIAGKDKIWHWADVKIDGKSLTVSSPKVAEPVAVRYAWHTNPCLSLFNKEGLPASPFRTDQWKLGR